MNHNYVLKTNDAIVVPDENKATLAKIKYGVLIFALAFLIISLMLRAFIKIPIWIILIVLMVAIAFLFVNTNKRVPTPVELYFYDDYFIICHPVRYHSKSLARKDFNKILYTDVKKCVYYKNFDCIFILSKTDKLSFDYQQDGTPNQTPNFSKQGKSLTLLITQFFENIDIVNEFQNHCPIKIDVKGN